MTNNGIINAPNGEVILAAGQTVQLLDTGTPGVSVAITGAQGNATNLGQIISEAGQIGIAGVLVNNSGTLNASSVVKQGGRIFLQASQDAYVDGAGRIVATGTKGGSIEVLGNRVAVTDNASLDASGQNGGGTVLVGGDEHGANPAVQNATMTYVGPNASIKADATQNGDGGKVIVWSDDYTQFYGAISARGGAQSGNGGFVETSGKQSLEFAGGLVDTRAPNGAAGLWLLDPSNLTIDGIEASTLATAIENGNVEVTASGNGDGSTTNGNINFQSDLNLTTGSGYTFAALAGENINLWAYNITTSGHNVVLTANATGYGGSGYGSITSTAGYGNITTNGGNITLSGVAVTVGALNTTGMTGTAGRTVILSTSLAGPVARVAPAEQLAFKPIARSPLARSQPRAARAAVEATGSAISSPTITPRLADRVEQGVREATSFLCLQTAGRSIRETLTLPEDRAEPEAIRLDTIIIKPPTTTNPVLAVTEAMAAR